MACDVPTVRRIIKEFSGGGSLESILKINKIRSEDFLDTVFSSEIIMAEYSRAREIKAEIHVGQIIDIADNDPDPNSARVRIDARKWYASKIVPKQYGDRVDVNHNHTIDIGQALSDARSRAALISPLKQVDQVEPIEFIDSAQGDEVNSVVDTPIQNDIEDLLS